MCSIAKAHTYTHTQKKVFFGGKIATSAKCVCVRESWNDRMKNPNERKGDIESKRIQRNEEKKKTHRTQYKPSNKLLLLFWYLANVNRAFVYLCVCAASIQYHSFAYIHIKSEHNLIASCLLTEILISRFN